MTTFEWGSSGLSAGAMKAALLYRNASPIFVITGDVMSSKRPRSVTCTAPCSTGWGRPRVHMLRGHILLAWTSYYLTEGQAISQSVLGEHQERMDCVWFSNNEL